jgi:2-polyprenyl-3-methyl-5-hydroxy-6-metoxy-1,4-benzoquinol methylase
MSTATGPTPERIFQMINAFQASDALKGAIELGLFTALGRETRTAPDLARLVGGSEKGTRVLCDFLVVHGLLLKDGDRYRSAPDAALFLDKSSPAYFGSVGQFMLAPEVVHAYSDIAAVVRKGGTLLPGQGTVEPNNPIWVEFARSMVPLMAPSAAFIADLVTRDVPADRPLRVLDIAAGHGMFGISIATRLAAARIDALDWPAVLEVAAENAAKAGVADRYTGIAGNAFEHPFDAGYDVILLTNFLHHFDRPTCVALLRKAHAALAPGGRAVTLEFVPNDDRITPPGEAAFAMIMLATTAAGDAYTFAELDAMAREAGFRPSELHRLTTAPQTVVVSSR